MEVLQVKGLCKSYPERIFGKRTVHAVKNVDFSIQKGEVVGVLGHNGAGKTSTIKIIAGLVKKDAGSVNIFENEMTSYRQMASDVGILLEGSRNLYLKLTCAENLMYFGRMKGISNNKILKTRIEEMLRFFNLTDAKDRLAGNLSRGMLQKLSIAVTIIHNPELIILDEPTLGLDIPARRELLELIRKLAKENGKTVLLTSHMLEIVEQIADRVIIFDKGTIIADEKIDALKAVYSKDIAQVVVHNQMEGLPILESLPGLINIEQNEQHQELAYNYYIKDKNEFLNIFQCILANQLEVRGVLQKRLSLEDVYVLLTERSMKHAE